ncbi:MAG: hypothetical protein QXQ40_00465 [Candidatus Aenigmatarchaeota archaeon]
MLFKTTKNWKKYLNVDDEIILNDILKKTAKHRGAYKNSDEIKIAQLWCSLIEAEKKINTLDARLKRLEYILGGIIKRAEEDKDALLKSLRGF